MWLYKRSWGSVLAVVACVLPMAMGVPSAQAAVQSPFRDVGPMTPHLGDIRWLASAGISTGWPMGDGTSEFRGMDTVKRQDMAAFLRREATRSTVSDAASWKPSTADRTRFRDVRCIAGNPNGANTPHCEDILWLAHAGISTGWKEQDGSTTFRGMSPIVRQDMAAFLKRLADKADKADGVTPKTDFTDVTSRTPHAAEVQWLGGSGISQGYRNANGTWRFEGMTPVYRQDMAAFIHRLDNLFNCERNKTLIKEAWTETVNHPAEEKVVTPGHYETVIIKDKEWVPPVTKEEPVYETQNVEMTRFPDGYERPASWGEVTWEEMDAHGDYYSTYVKTMQVQTGTTTIIVTPGYWTEPVTEQKWVDPVTETIPAWTETIDHPAITEEVTIPAVTHEETNVIREAWDEEVTHPAEYKDVYHPAITHEEERTVPEWTETITHPAEYTEKKVQTGTKRVQKQGKWIPSTGRWVTV